MPKINNFYPHSVTGKTDDSFVGLKIKGNEIHFYYPESYRFDVDSPYVRNDIVDMLRTISIAKTASTERSQIHTTFNDNSNFALYSYLWVISDYLTNGLYVNRERLYKINQSGSVNWKRTMQMPPIVSDGNIIFPDIVVEVKNNIDNILVEIHKYCLKKSIDFIGWLFNLTSNGIETQPFNDSVKKLYLLTLRKELDKTFDDDKRVRLRHFSNVLTGLDNTNNSKEFVYGVDSYYYVFERMIDSIFGNVKGLKSFNPKAKWQLVRNGFKETQSSDLRPDTIIIKGNDVFVLDSKFYRFGYTGKEDDLPETTSIQKQITYGDYIKRNVTLIDVVNIYSAFILPYDKKRAIFHSNEDIQYIGFAKSTWKDNTQNHELIHTFLIDLHHVVKTWNKLNHEKDVNFLIESIVNSQKEAQLLIL